MAGLPVTSTLLACLLAGAAAALMLRCTSRTRLPEVLPPQSVRRTAEGGRGSGRASRPSSVLVASGIGGVGVAVVVGGLLGVLLGAAAATAAVVVLSRLEPRTVRERRERMVSDLPITVDLLAACLVVGRPPSAALRAVLAAVGGPLAQDLSVVTLRLELGSDPVGVWRELGGQSGPVAPLGRTMARSLETGAPLAADLRRLSDDLRRRGRAHAQQRARNVGVRAAAPLGLCFLPAFVLIGVVPSIVSAFAALSWW